MIIWIIAGLVGTFLIAALSIGLTAGSMASRPRRSVYDLEEAMDFVAGRLDDEITAVVSYEQLGSVLQFHCDYLELKGVASGRTADDVGSDLVVVPDDEPIAYVLGRVDSENVDLTDEQVMAILDAETEYYRAIGLFGPQV